MIRQPTEQYWMTISHWGMFPIHQEEVLHMSNEGCCKLTLELTDERTIH